MEVGFNENVDALVFYADCRKLTHSALASRGKMQVDKMGDLGAAWTQATVEEAAAIAREHFGVIGEPTRFATEKDDTFRIATSSGESWVLKIANPQEDAQEIAFQNAVLDHIARTDPDIRIPRLRRNNRGEPIAAITMADGVSRKARMLSFIAGTPLDAVDATGPERRKVGEVLGRLRLALQDFSHSADSRVLLWDVRHLLTLEELLPFIERREHRQVVEHGLARFREIAPEISETRFQVLHNDFSRSNIVVDKADPEFVSGIIDFGDTVRTSVAIDVGTALANQLPRESQDDMFQAGRDLLSGYLSVADLKDRELALLPHLAMARVLARALITSWRAKIMPENATYVLRNTQQGWSQLDWFMSRDIATISASVL